MDVKAIGDSLGTVFNGLVSLLTSGSWVVIAALLLFAAWLTRSASGKEITRGLKANIFSNWRLALLGTTGVVLSLASGWTTWDGMRNFTKEPLLSMMITFGIQGVMLIVAWLIGESFAIGMNQQSSTPARSGLSKSAQAAGGAVFGTMLFIALLTLVLQTSGQVDVRHASTTELFSAKWADKLLIVVVGLSLAALFVLYSASDLVKPYLQSSRVIVKNGVLWVMFLACMATSVFFSFDSLFTAIFPQSERVRAAELRAQNQVAGIVSDIGNTIQSKQIQEVEELFKSDGWKAYDRHLSDLEKASQGAERDIESYFVQQMEARRGAIAQQQERIASAVSSQAGLASKKTTMTEELSRLKADRPALAADLSEKKSELDTRLKSIDAKRVEAMAEDKGVEGTGKVGKGPVYRQRVDELAKMQDYVKIQDDRVKDAQKRLSASDTRIAQIERELAAVDGDLAKLKGEAQTAQSRIKVAEDSKAGEEGPKVDPARVRLAFETARTEFRQEPTAERLGRVQQLCTQLHNAMASTPATRDRVRGVDCDPKNAAEASARVFALNDGIATFAKQCAGGDKLNQQTSADALFSFARKCLADSGLPSRETDQLRTKINFIELNRDDKAHRFVVTWNAFQDGNRLAYLALAIAIAIDSLVFMSGLFGANAVRSPLSDVPSTKARSARQLEAIIDTALIPHKFETARLVLGAMLPMTQRDGYMARIVVDENDPHAGDLRRILNAGSTIGAVRHAENDEHVYEIRAELFEYLSGVAKKEFEANHDHVNLAEMERTVTVALLPMDEMKENADAILAHMHPMYFPETLLEKLGWKKEHGFMAEIKIGEVPATNSRVVRNALNAGASFDRVQRVGDDAGHYYIHRDFYKTLVRIRAQLLSTAGHHPAIPGPGNAGPTHGGKLTAQRAAIGKRQTNQLPPPEGNAIDWDGERQREPLKKAERVAVQSNPKHFVEYWCELVRALNIEPEPALKRLDADQTEALALEAWKLLDDLARTNKQLSELLREHEKEQSNQIESADADLQHSIQTAVGDRQAMMDALEEAHNHVLRVLPALMLFPENGLLDFLINNIERAAQPDNGLASGEQDLLDVLRQVRHELARADLADARIWQSVGQALQRLSAERSANIARRFSQGGDKRLH